MELQRLRRAGRRAAMAMLLLVATAAYAEDSGHALDTAVHTANAEWAQAMKTGDAAAIAAPYTDDAVFVLADGKVVHGRAAIETMYRDGFRKGALATATTIATKHLVRDGEFAYESGAADVTVVRQGRTVTQGGRYLTVWQAQADGAWKIVRNIVLP